jgi:predicted ThiF/HesA family dinucleotide-utilizing enzyme
MLFRSLSGVPAAAALALAAAPAQRCNSIRTQTCVGNLALAVGHRVVGLAQYEITGGRAQAVAVGVRRGAKGKGSATVSTYDARGRPARARTSITLS